MFHSAVVLGSVFIMAQFLQTGLGFSAFGAGLGLLPWTGSMLAVGPVAGRFADRYGARTVMIAGLGLAAVGYTWLAAVSRADRPYPVLVGALVITGIGNSAVFPAISAAVAGSVDHNDIGPASGVNNAVAELGGVLGVALVAVAFSTAGSYADPRTVAHGFSGAVGLCAVLSTASAVAAVAVPRIERPTKDAATAAMSAWQAVEPISKRRRPHRISPHTDRVSMICQLLGPNYRTKEADM